MHSGVGDAFTSATPSAWLKTWWHRRWLRRGHRSSSVRHSPPRWKLARRFWLASASALSDPAASCVPLRRVYVSIQTDLAGGSVIIITDCTDARGGGGASRWRDLSAQNSAFPAPWPAGRSHLRCSSRIILPLGLSSSLFPSFSFFRRAISRAHRRAFSRRALQVFFFYCAVYTWIVLISVFSRFD